MTGPHREQDSGSIKVSEVSIAQLSRGLYRSNAAAFKELVSNAWDADATEVRIDTNFPEFDFISCVDNGPGMSLKQFLAYFNEYGIGYCFKRRGHTSTTDLYNRPIIGRLGVGMLAVGQLCHSFEIESHYLDDNGDGKAYRAEIILLDETITDVEESISSEAEGREDIEVGKWNYEIIPYDNAKRGFRILSNDVRDTFTAEMKVGLEGPKRDALSFQLSKLHSIFYDNITRSIRECKPYLETIWELSMLCPLPYYGDITKYPIKLSSFEDEALTDEYQEAMRLIQERQSRFVDWQFRISFDGVELWRLIQFARSLEVMPRLYHIAYDNVVAERRLKFSGYIYAQTQAVRPLELNGVQIRLHGVGIGGYDSTFLKYYEQINTIRSRWASGEIFVDEGLEAALNIDRDSFNEHDEHFKTLQSELHRKMDSVFNDIEKIAKRDRDFKHDRIAQKLSGRLEEILTSGTEGKLEVSERELGKETPLVTVDEADRKLVVNTSLKLLKKKKASMILRQAALAYWIAVRTADSDEERFDSFIGLLREILSELV